MIGYVFGCVCDDIGGVYDCGLGVSDCVVAFGVGDDVWGYGY